MILNVGESPRSCYNKLMQNQKVSLFEIAKVFLTIGTVAVGGWPSIIALTQKYCVEEKKWLSMDEFSHGVALSQFLGPFAVNSTIFVGYRVRGFQGALTALLSFLSPSIICVIVLSALYTKFHTIPALESSMRAIGPVVIALILSAAYNMGKNKINSPEPVILMLLAIILSAVFKVQVISILLISLAYAFIRTRFFTKGGENEAS